MLLERNISKCVTCQTRNLKKVKAPLKETDIPPYAFAKIAVDLSGQYPRTLANNRYIVSFIDLYSGWSESFAVPDKSADNIVHLIMDQIFPQYGCPLQLLSDNDTENVNSMVQDTLKQLNIHHVRTSIYRPQSNAKVERFHRVLGDVLAKMVLKDPTTWDICLNQCLAAIRFNISDSTKFSPFYLLYNRDVVLPIDNLLKPRRKYLGEQAHMIQLELQHKSFVLVHKRLRSAKKRQARYADIRSKLVEFKVGDPVYLKNHRRHSKLDTKWQPYYRIMEKKSPRTYTIVNQLTGKKQNSHVEYLRLAEIDQWEIPKANERHPFRAAQYAINPSSSSEEDNEIEADKLSEQSSGRIESDYLLSTDDERLGQRQNKHKAAVEKLASRQKRERSDSSGSENETIPLFELAKKLKKDHTENQSDIELGSEKLSDNDTSASDTDNYYSMQEKQDENSDISDLGAENNMEIRDSEKNADIDLGTESDISDLCADADVIMREKKDIMQVRHSGRKLIKNKPERKRLEKDKLQLLKLLIEKLY